MKKLLFTVFVLLSQYVFAQEHTDEFLINRNDSLIRSKPTLPARTADQFKLLIDSKVSLLGGDFWNTTGTSTLTGPTIIQSGTNSLAITAIGTSNIFTIGTSSSNHFAYTRFIGGGGFSINIGFYDNIHGVIGNADTYVGFRDDGTNDNYFGFIDNGGASYFSAVSAPIRYTNSPTISSGNDITNKTYVDARIATTITDGVTTSAPNQNVVFDALALKQPTLVSGTNIKTINSTSILGSGDIVISGISGSTGSTDNVILMSDGTGGSTLNVSELIALVDGGIQLGATASVNTDRNFTAVGSQATIDINFLAKGSGGAVTIDNTGGQGFLQVGIGVAQALYGITAIQFLKSGAGQDQAISGAAGIASSTIGSNFGVSGGNGFGSGDSDGGDLLISGGAPNGSGAPGIIQSPSDLAINDATKGLILKDTQGTPHYWRITVSTVGVLIITDLGTTLP